MQRRWRIALFGSRESQLGFSLIEVLLSIAMTILLTDQMVRLCMTLIKQQALLQEKITLAENTQFAEFILRRELQTAGFCGCNGINQLNIYYHLSRWYLPIIPIQIFSKDTQIMGKKIHPESDVLVIEKMAEKTTNFLGKLNLARLKKCLQNEFDPKELFIIADCQQADVFALSDVPTLLSLNRYDHAEIGKLVVHAFFIAKTSRKNQSSQPIKALYSYDFIHQRKTELVAGVEAMEFFYVDSDNDENQKTFKPLTNTVDLVNLRLIKIILSLSSENPVVNAKERLHKKHEVLIYLRE